VETNVLVVSDQPANSFVEHFRPMRILVTNDDGIESPGLSILEQIASEYGETWVIAPDTEHSGSAHSATLGSPIPVNKVHSSRVSVKGTPIDCIRLGLSVFAEKVDWVFSGINHGANLGVDLHSSGTVAAAREAAIMAYPALAISHLMRSGDPIDWEWIRSNAKRLIDFVLSQDHAERCFWNLNIPLHRGSKECPISCCPVDSKPVPLRFTSVEDCFICSIDYHSRPYAKCTDVDLCFRGHATVSKMLL
jgi:5'-nucleotidase